DAAAQPLTPRIARKRWLPRLRFSLRTLLSLVLTGTAAAFLYRDWAPWREVAVVEEQPIKGLHDDYIDVKTIAISPDGNLFTTAKRFPSDDGDEWKAELNILDTSYGRLVNTLKGHRQFISSAAFSSDGSQL